MKRELWLSRDEYNEARFPGCYNIHEIKPDKDEDGVFHGQVTFFCAEPFHRLVEGARLRKGRKKRIKRILIELED